MKEQIEIKTCEKQIHSGIDNPSLNSIMRPLRLNGLVNIDNISDKEYEMIRLISEATYNNEIRWNAQNVFIQYIRTIITNKFESLYWGIYNDYVVTLTDNYSGKVSITVTKGFPKKTVLETFIPRKPQFINGRRVGSFRESYLFKLLMTIKFQTGENTLSVFTN
ncbi:MAG: hypothetical protein AB1782_20390 [Cyanobacteriota bacterium]